MLQDAMHAGLIETRSESVLLADIAYLASVQLTRCNHCHSQCWMLGERGIPYTPIQCLWYNPLPMNPTPPTSNIQILELILPVLPLADLLFTQRVTGMKQLMKVLLPP